jgi:hypothetical protein
MSAFLQGAVVLLDKPAATCGCLNEAWTTFLSLFKVGGARGRAQPDAHASRAFFVRMPCLSAFSDERTFPSGLFGPRDLAPFLRLTPARTLLEDAHHSSFRLAANPNHRQPPRKSEMINGEDCDDWP